jgi:hypothetical protein
MTNGSVEFVFTVSAYFANVKYMESITERNCVSRALKSIKKHKITNYLYLLFYKNPLIITGFLLAHRHRAVLHIVSKNDIV